MKKLTFVKSVSLLSILGFAGCTNLTPRQGDFDDMYGSSASVVVINKNYYSASSPQNVPSREPSYSSDFDRSSEFVEESIGDVYFPEDYVSSTQIRRNRTADPGYSAGYSQGYREGWNDYAWAQPMGWNSPFNRFSYNPWFGAGFNSFDPFSPFGFYNFSPFGFNNFNRLNRFSTFGLYAGFSTGFGGFYDPFFGPGFGNPWMMSPWDYGFGFSPFGFNSFGYRNAFAWNNPYRPIIITNNYIGSDKSRIASRTYGARTGGRGTDNYNDRYQGNNRSSARVAANGNPNTPPSRVNAASQQNRVASTGYIAERAARGNGTYINSGTSTGGRTANAATNSGTAYSRSVAPSSSSDSFNATRSTSSSYNQSARSFDYARPARSTYSTPSASSRASGSTPSYSPSSRSSSSSSSSSRSYSAPATRSYSPSSSSSSSMGGSSRGSSGGSSSSIGGGRGPR